MKRIVLVLVVMGLFVNGRVNGQGNCLWARQATGGKDNWNIAKDA